jgi:hypothetical protein
MAMRTRAKKLPLDKKECETVHDWFMFVESPQRTSIDTKFCDKIHRTITTMVKKNSYDSFLISTVEAQIIGRWYLMVPQKLRDNLDDKIYRALERFIDKN